MYASNVYVVQVQSVEWHLGFPLGSVRDTRDGRLFKVGLVHQTFVNRDHIGPGSLLEVSADGVHIIQSVRPGDYLSRSFESSDVFDRWFLFRRVLGPYLPKHIMFMLFRSGLETITSVMDNVGTVLQIPGIGPVTQAKIRAAISEIQRGTISRKIPEDAQ